MAALHSEEALSCLAACGTKVLVSCLGPPSRLVGADSGEHFFAASIRLLRTSLQSSSSSSPISSNFRIHSFCWRVSFGCPTPPSFLWVWLSSFGASCPRGGAARLLPFLKLLEGSDGLATCPPSVGSVGLEILFEGSVGRVVERFLSALPPRFPLLTFDPDALVFLGLVVALDALDLLPVDCLICEENQVQKMSIK